MKKALIAGAASLAIAAMPVASTFAAAKTVVITDTLTTTVSTACVFKRYGAAGAGSQTSMTTGPSWAGKTAADEADTAAYAYSATLTPGSSVELGTSTFTAYCNATGGFTVTVETPALKNGSDNINFAAATPTDAAGWTLKKSGSGGLVAATGATFMSASSATDSASAVTETATYNVYTTASTPFGTYQGNVVYTFSYTDPNEA